jgi:hypothetical protein
MLHIIDHASNQSTTSSINVFLANTLLGEQQLQTRAANGQKSLHHFSLLLCIAQQQQNLRGLFALFPLRDKERVNGSIP